MGNYLTDPLIFLIQVVVGLYILVLMLRVILQLVRADFFNPISQFIVKVTDPVLKPLRRIVPNVGRLDSASVVVMWILQAITLSLISVLAGKVVGWLAPALWAIPELIELAINVFLFAILIEVILSWVNPGAYNPATALLNSLTKPLLNPARRLIPPISGLDLSPMVVIIGLILLKMLLLPPIQTLVSLPLR